MLPARLSSARKNSQAAPERRDRQFRDCLERDVVAPALLRGWSTKARLAGVVVSEVFGTVGRATAGSGSTTDRSRAGPWNCAAASIRLAAERDTRRPAGGSG